MSKLPSIGLATREMMRMRGLGEVILTVDAMADITPHMRRVEMHSPQLANFTSKAGQDLVLMLPDDSGEASRRHYTIRSFDLAAQRLSIDFVLHGDEGLAMRWLAQVREGDQIVAFGPRGRNVIHDGAGWRLFVGDETGLPAIAAMIETLPAGAHATAIIEVPDAADTQSITTPANVDIIWLPRGGAPKPPSEQLIAAVNAWQPPDGEGHCYLLAETGAVRAIRRALLERGISKESIFAEGYWRTGRIGGHDHV